MSIPVLGLGQFFQQVNEAATKLQAAFRGFLVRKGLVAERLVAVEENECSICLGEFVPEENKPQDERALRHLIAKQVLADELTEGHHCHHVFHKGCIDQHIKVSEDAGKAITCPFCRDPEFINHAAKEQAPAVPVDLQLEATLLRRIQEAVLAEKDLNVALDDGRTFLHLAAQSGSLRVVEQLLAQGVEVSPKDGFDKTPLHVAAIFGHAHLIRVLCAAEGIDINSGDIIQQTPLHEAAEKGNVAVVRSLLRLGADPAPVDALGQTPMDKAVQYKQERVIAVLKHYI